MGVLCAFLLSEPDLANPRKQQSNPQKWQNVHPLAQQFKTGNKLHVTACNHDDRTITLVGRLLCLYYWCLYIETILMLTLPLHLRPLQISLIIFKAVSAALQMNYVASIHRIRSNFAIVDVYWYNDNVKVIIKVIIIDVYSVSSYHHEGNNCAVISSMATSTNQIKSWLRIIKMAAASQTSQQPRPQNHTWYNHERDGKEKITPLPRHTTYIDWTYIHS